MNRPVDFTPNYPLDFYTVVRHVATELEKARPEGRVVSVSEMARTYTNYLVVDVDRVKRAEGFDNDRDAIAFLVEKAIAALGPDQVEAVDGGFRLTRPFDKVRYRRRKLHRADVNPFQRFNEPFSPLSGRFAEAFPEQRTLGWDASAKELRESMREFGWLPELPAVRDERGVVIAGRRRLEVANELGIEPVVTVVAMGRGDDADARRLKLAIASNLGSKPFGPGERKTIAEYLYGEQAWSTQHVGQALQVAEPLMRRETNGHRGSRSRPEDRELELKVEELMAKGMGITAIGRELGFKGHGNSMKIAAAMERVKGRQAEREEARDRAEAILPSRYNLHGQTVADLASELRSQLDAQELHELMNQLTIASSRNVNESDGDALTRR